MAAKKKRKSQARKARGKKRQEKGLPKGIPSPETVLREFDIQLPGGKTFHVRRTNQKDPYDSP